MMKCAAFFLLLSASFADEVVTPPHVERKLGHSSSWSPPPPPPSFKFGDRSVAAMDACTGDGWKLITDLETCQAAASWAGGSISYQSEGDQQNWDTGGCARYSHSGGNFHFNPKSDTTYIDTYVYPVCEYDPPSPYLRGDGVCPGGGSSGSVCRDQEVCSCSSTGVGRCACGEPSASQDGCCNCGCSTCDDLCGLYGTDEWVSSPPPPPLPPSPPTAEKYLRGDGVCPGGYASGTVCKDSQICTCSSTGVGRCACGEPDSSQNGCCNCGCAYCVDLCSTYGVSAEADSPPPSPPPPSPVVVPEVVTVDSGSLLDALISVTPVATEPEPEVSEKSIFRYSELVDLVKDYLEFLMGMLVGFVESAFAYLSYYTAVVASSF